MHLHWTRCRPRHTRIEFVDEGQVHVERGELESELRDLIDAVLERLHGDPETGLAANNLGRAWNAVNNLDPDEREFSRAASLLGIDPFDVQDSVADAIVTFWESTDPSVREDALATATEDSLTRVAEWLDDAIEALAKEEQSNGWSDVRQALPPPPLGVEPWERGYALARAAREWIGRNGGPIDLGRLGSLAILQHETQPPSHRIHGLVAADTPACVTAPRGESGGKDGS